MAVRSETSLSLSYVTTFLWYGTAWMLIIIAAYATEFTSKYLPSYLCRYGACFQSSPIYPLKWLQTTAADLGSWLAWASFVIAAVFLILSWLRDDESYARIAAFYSSLVVFAAALALL